MTELIGRQLGNYQLEALLTTGATGKVYRAQQLQSRRPAALKLFAAELLTRPGVRPRLLQALHEVAALRDPRIVSIDDVGEHEGLLYAAGELVAGDSLQERLQSGSFATLSLALRVELIAQAAEALAVAHSAGMIHGAIKPASLLLTASDPPRLKLADLGVAVVLDEEAYAAPTYLSPERCRGQMLDPRADLYSLGVVLYELLTGQPPFKIANLEEAIERHLRKAPTPPRMIRPELPAELEAVVLRCLAKAPAERFPDATALATALRQALPRATPPLARLQLYGLQGVAIRDVEIPVGLFSVGSGSDQDLVLDDPAVEPTHLRIEWDGRQFSVTDLSTPGGVLLGNLRLPSGLAVPWAAWEPVRIGPYTLLQAQAVDLNATTSAVAAVVTELPARMPDSAEVALPPVLDEPAAPVAPQITLLAAQPQSRLNPEQPATVILRLRNSGESAAEIHLLVEGVPAAWLGDLSPVQVAPASETLLRLHVLVPRTPEALAGEYAVRVRALLAGHPDREAFAELRWSVLPFAACELRIIPSSAESHTTAAYQLDLRNGGNAPATYRLRFLDDDESLGFKLEQDELSLDPGQSARLSLQVTAAGRLFGNPERRPFTIQADAGADDFASVNAELVQQATLPAWTPLALFGALLVGLLFAVLPLLGNNNGGGQAGIPTAPIIVPLPTELATPTVAAPTELPTPSPFPIPGQPVIYEFRVWPEQVAPGEVAMVIWAVQDAERVVIDRFGEVPVIGQAEIRPQESTTFQLDAAGPGGTISQIIAVTVVAPTAAPPTVAPPTLVPPTVAPPTVAPPTLAPPTVAPPTLVPPTVAPPTVAPPTVAPPTVAPPTLAPPTAMPTAPIPPAFVIYDLVAQAREATWSTNDGRTSFGRPLLGAEAGGWADQANATLEDGRAYETLLLTVPPVASLGSDPLRGPFIQAAYEVPPLGPGQILVGALGFGQGVSSPAISVTISFAGTPIFTTSKVPDGKLLPIFADLSAYNGQSGPLTLTSSAPNGPAAQGLYWVRPRIDVPR